MKKKLILFLLFPFFIFSQDLFSQDYKDCETAYNPCGESPFHLDGSEGHGVMDAGIDTTCVLGESNSTWITWTVMQGGTLTFVLTPDSIEDDLDFIVYKFGVDNDCATKELIRCMASGENVGQPPSTWEDCVGPTGLAIGEVDVQEVPGCTSSDNNCQTAPT